jgi:hypothetical protein
MTPWNPTTRSSPRMPKMKELEFNKGSTLANVRELEFVSKKNQLSIIRPSNSLPNLQHSGTKRKALDLK